MKVDIIHVPTNKIVKTVETVTQAEEWLVDEIDPKTQTDYIFAPDEDAEVEMAKVAIGESTEEPDDMPMNDIAALRATLSVLLDALEGTDALAYDAVAEACEQAKDLLESIADSDVHPYVRVFDEATTAGREDLLSFIAHGEDKTVSLADVLTEQTATELRRPMLKDDAIRWLRRKARSVTHALGNGPLSFAVPGMRALLAELEDAVMVPVIEDYRSDAYDPGTYDTMLPHVASYEDYEDGRRYVSKSELQRVASD